MASESWYQQHHTYSRNQSEHRKFGGKFLFYAKFPEISGTLGKRLKNKTIIKGKWGILRKNNVLNHV